MSTIASLKTLGWLAYTDTPPAFNTDTQYLTSEDVVGEDVITKTYTVNDYTEEEMVTRIADAKTAKKKTISSNCQSTILAEYPYVPTQINVANGLYSSAIGDPMKAHIANMITACHGYETDVDACETLAAIRDISPIWPEE